MPVLRVSFVACIYAAFVAVALMYGGRSHYHTLDCTWAASTASIKANYRRMARSTHPDKAPRDGKDAAQAAFVRLQEAHEVLADPARREEYDQQLAEETSQSAPWERALFWSSLWLWEATLLAAVLGLLLGGRDLYDEGAAYMWRRKRAHRLASSHSSDGILLTVSSAGWHTVMVTEGTALSWGRDDSGQCARGGGAAQRGRPGRVRGLEDVMTAAAGHSHTLLVTRDGTCHAAGDNTYGQLGDGLGGASRPRPCTMPTMAHVMSVAAGRAHSMAVLADGRIAVCGSNEFGQLGLGDLLKRKAFTIVGGGFDRVIVEEAQAGNGHSVILDAAGKV